MANDETLSLNEYREQRIANLRYLKEMGFKPEHKAFLREQLSVIRQNFVEDKEIRAAGRIMTVRRMGKATFATISDGSDIFQIFIKKDLLAEISFNAFAYLDLGDIIGVQGRLFITRTGEPTIEVHEWSLLAKAIMQPPEKYHGLQDIEERYRKRYLDLMVNQESRERFYKRSAIIAAMREYLQQRGYIEVETPVMQAQAGGAAAKPFSTYHNALGFEMVLRIAPELYLKRLLVGGLDKIFEIGKNFRNEGIDRTHNPEFTVLELYEAYGDCNTMKSILEGMLSYICEKVLGTLKVDYGTEGEVLDFTPPFRQITYQDAVCEVMGENWFELTESEMREAATVREITLDPTWNQTMITHEVYEKLVEKGLRQPTFVTRVPRCFIPLARGCEDNPELADVFEFVVAGKELCPGYTEQNDPFAQRSALENQAGEDPEKIDEDFLLALEHGMPPAGGLGLGIDRLVMLLTNTEVIRDVILFPQMKTLKRD